MTLRAPFAGQIGLREVSVGEFVDVGQDLVTLVRLDPIEVDFSVPETVLAQLRNGQKLRVTIDAYPDDTFAGEVVAIDPVVDANSRSARLRAQIPNPDGRLKPGQFAKLQIDTGTDDAAALLVPEQALMQDGDTRFVYTVVDGKARKTVIRTGARVPGMVQVLQGLKGGDGDHRRTGQADDARRPAVMVLPPQGAAGPGAAGAAKPAFADARPKAAADKAEQAK
jgi:membrane fusion protein (multidrug efflux system)